MINQSYSQGAQIWSVNYFLFFSVYLHMRQILLFFSAKFPQGEGSGFGARKEKQGKSKGL